MKRLKKLDVNMVLCWYESLPLLNKQNAGLGRQKLEGNVLLSLLAPTLNGNVPLFNFLFTVCNVVRLQCYHV